MLYIPGLSDLGIVGLPLTRVAFLAQLLLLLRSHNALYTSYLSFSLCYCQQIKP
jgi:hypothetical protein